MNYTNEQIKIIVSHIKDNISWIEVDPDHETQKELDYKLFDRKITLIFDITDTPFGILISNIKLWNDDTEITLPIEAVWKLDNIIKLNSELI